MAVSDFAELVPEDAAGLRLCKIVQPDDTLVLCEPVIFLKGRGAILTVLNRASISGHVGGEPRRTDDFWVDVLDGAEDHVSEVRLDRGSWNSLKNKWMRCRVDK